ncbi:hypothetical protein MAHJHV55_52590 [Mycobacterium avium subsp. hominissuis]
MVDDDAQRAAAGGEPADHVAVDACVDGDVVSRFATCCRALGFRYDTGLYLQFRATTTDDFQLAYAAVASAAA